MEKFVERWIAPSPAAASQFADKVIGDFYAGSTHAGRYETIEDDEDDETIERNHAPSGYMLAALGPLRDRTRTLEGVRAPRLKSVGAPWRVRRRASC